MAKPGPAPQTRTPRVLLAAPPGPAAAAARRDLDARGYLLADAASVAEALDALAAGKCDLAILAAELPGRDPLALIAEIRDRGYALPLLLTTPAGAADLRVRALNQGADDCLDAPFHPGELAARAGALLRRAGFRPAGESGPVLNPQLAIGDVKLHRLRRQATVHDAPVALTLREFDLLEYLMRAGGAVRTREKILTTLWSGQADSSEHLLDVYIGRLRTKLADAGASPDFIETVRGVGYRIAT
ncbi:MAG: response regulator transcription factor [Candidatus Sumerlaeia bacterium]|nr:response regulator transcription factor [Candidatus Sumerlaeia bacterium]